MRYLDILTEANASLAELLVAKMHANTPENVALDIVPADESRVTLETLYVHGPARHTGLASKTMTMLCQFADELGVSIEVQPMPTEGDISTEALRDFYAGFGFETDAVSGWMVR